MDIGSQIDIPLRFYTNTGEKMRIFSNGNVFIGSSPSDNGAKLSIAGGRTFINTGQTTASTAAYTAFNNLTFNDDFSNAANGPNKIITYGRGSTWVAGIGIHDNTQAYYAGGTHKFYRYDGTTATLNLALESNGNLLIGTGTDSGDKLRVAGTTFSNEIMTLLPEAESRSGINWRFGAASIASITPNRRLRVKVGGIEYYIGAVEV